MTRRWLVTLLSVVVVLGGLATPARAADAGSLSGVLQWSDGRPYYRDITLWRDGARVASAYTNSRTGAFTFTGLAAGGGYQISWRLGFSTDAYLPGFLDRAEAATFTVVDGQDTVVDARIRPYGAAHGRVTLPDGSPAAGYRVRMEMDPRIGDVEHGATTAADGTWRVPDLFPEDYRAEVSNPARTLTRVSGPATVPSGGDTTFDLTWRPGATITVRAVDAATGDPVRDFCATAQPSRAHACTGRHGTSLVLTDLPAGTATVTVEPTKRSDYLPPAGPFTVTLTDGGAGEVTARLTLGGRLTTTVLDRATGQPVHRVCVTLAVPGEGAMPVEQRKRLGGREHCSDAAGELSTWAHPAGTYNVFVFAINRRGRPDGRYGHQWLGAVGGTGDQRQAVRVTIRPGGTAKAPTVLMDPPRLIKGTVRNPDGTSIRGSISFAAWNHDARQFDGTGLRVGGHYKLRNLGPYAWPLVVQPAYPAPRQWSGGTGNRFQAETTPVTGSGTETEFDIVLRVPAALEGTLTAPGPGRLIAVNAGTGDEMAFAAFTGSGPYRMDVIGGQRVKIKWLLDSGAEGWWADGALVQVPNNGTKTVDLTVG